jgi:hypothetical protein
LGEPLGPLFKVQVTLEDGTEMLSQNVGNYQIYGVQHPRREKISSRLSLEPPQPPYSTDARGKAVGV